jgi:hypothetical protein
VYARLVLQLTRLPRLLAMTSARTSIHLDLLKCSGILGSDRVELCWVICIADTHGILRKSEPSTLFRDCLRNLVVASFQGVHCIRDDGVLVGGGRRSRRSRRRGRARRRPLRDARHDFQIGSRDNLGSKKRKKRRESIHWGCGLHTYTQSEKRDE